jgi:hypothetical protein
MPNDPSPDHEGRPARADDEAERGAPDPFGLDLADLTSGDLPTAEGSDAAEGRALREALAVARRALAPVQASLAAAGFYAYGTLDDANRWTIAADDEAGRIDVRVGPDGFEVVLWASSPGLYAEEENEFRRRALERLARMTLPNIARGALQPHQSATWDETDRGIAVSLRYELPFTQGDQVGAFARQRLPELDELLTFVESRVAS